jgi:RNA polymerase sigma-70 factor (ECF subfamily)
MEENELIASAKNGDLRAFSELVIRHQSGVRATLAVRLHDRHEADDLAQEAFIVAHRKLWEFDTDRAFGPWIRSIALNLLRNYQRKHKASAIGGEAELELMIKERIEVAHSHDHIAEKLAALKHCQSKLDAPMRELLQMRYFDDLPVAEICKELKVRHSTVTMRLYRLRETLQNCIQQKMGNV